MNIRWNSNNSPASSIFGKASLSIGRTNAPAPVRQSTKTRSSAPQSEDTAEQVAPNARQEFSKYAKMVQSIMDKAREIVLHNSRLKYEFNPLNPESTVADGIKPYQQEIMSAGKTDDELLEMAAFSLRWYHNDELEKIADFAELPEGQNTITAPDGTEMQIRLMKDTNEQRIKAAGVEYEKRGADIVFELESIRNELSRATGLGNVDMLGSIEKPSALSFESQLENLAANYAFYQKQAGDTYSGDELDSVMQMLDTEFSAKLGEVIDNFTAGGEADYMQGDMQGIKDSLTALFDEKKQYFTDVIGSDSFTTGVEGTENEWANSAAVFVTGKLLNHAAADTQRTGDTAAKYTATDLKAMATMSVLANPPLANNEEQLGMHLGMDAIMIKMFESTDMTEAGKQQLRDSFELRKQSAIAEANEKMAASRADPYRLKGYSYDNFDEKAVDNAIDIMLGALDNENFAEGLADAFMKINDTFLNEQSAQKNSGGTVQERYRVYNDPRLTAVGLTNEVMAFNNLGLNDENLTARIGELAKAIGSDKWAVPNDLQNYVDLSA